MSVLGFEICRNSQAIRDLVAVESNGDHIHGDVYPTAAASSSPILEDERLVSGNPLFQTAEHPGGNRYPTPAGLLRTDEAPPSAAAAPRLGQHTEQVLAELLGLSGTALGRLFDRSVVAGPR